MPAKEQKNAPVRVLYASTLVSAETYSALFSRAKVKPSLAAQKYHGLMTRGLARNGVEVLALTAPPVSRLTSERLFVRLPGEEKDGVHFRYLPVLQIPVVKHALVYLGAFFCALKQLRKTDYAVCDGLNLAVSSGVRAAARLKKRPCVAIVTDVPEILAGGPTRTARLNTRELARFDGYILLTEAMDALVNPNKRPHIVAEGQVDAAMSTRENILADKAQEKIVLYAGMLHAQYGVVTLAEAFSSVQDPDARLVYYGDGDATQTLREAAANDKRIELRGVADNETVVREELKATLLVNPRPSGETFTAYSFPSKNLEYMVSGTPVLTTKLSGMPREYDEYDYLFTDESVEGMASALRQTLSLPRETLHEKGRAAKAFVLANKSNKAQAKRVLALLGVLDDAKNEANQR